MARSLTLNMDRAMTDQKRKPAWKVVIYDVRNGVVEMSDIVGGGSFPSSEWRDFTEDIWQLSIDEVAGDYLKQGVAASSVMISVLDPHGLFDPLSGSEGRWLRQTNVVRIWEGDERVDPSEWPMTFTGELVGQAGVLRGRTVGSGGTALITAKALGREARFLRYTTTSENFVRGTQYNLIGTALAQDDLQLDAAEIDFSGWGNSITGHLSTQFIEENALVSIAKLMFPDMAMPRFNGEGKLTQTDGVITKSPARVYDDMSMLLRLVRPFSELNGVNRVIVKGLDAEMTEVLQPRQLLKTVDITTGYFARDEEIDVWWAEDKSVLCKNIDFVILVGMNSGLSILGGDEEWDDTPSDQGEGTIGGVITVTTGWAPYVLIFLGAIYIVLAVIPDLVLSFIAGETISVGRLIQAIALALMMIIMTKIGRGKYELYGEPFEYLFAEIVSIAETPAGLLIKDRRERVVTNHLIQNESDADNAARNGLFREQAKQNVRQFQMLWDARLEPDDIFELSDETRHMIASIKRTMVRGVSGVFADVNAYEVTEGVLP